MTLMLSALLSKLPMLADYYDYDYGYGGSGDDVALAAMAGFYIVYFIVMIAFSVIGIIAQWRIFTKARKPGWYSIIPFLNLYTLFDIIYGAGWKFLLLLIPGLNTVLAFFMYYRLGKAFGKGTGFILGLIFLCPIFILILGFDSSRYQGPQKDCFI